MHQVWFGFAYFLILEGRIKVYVLLWRGCIETGIVMTRKEPDLDGARVNEKERGRPLPLLRDGHNKIVVRFFGAAKKDPKPTVEEY